MSDNKGLIQIYTGDGKGKTTAALGLAFRAAGRGRKVHIIQFMKPEDSTGEHFSVKYFKDLIKITPVGRKKWLINNEPDEVDVKLAEKGLGLAKDLFIRNNVDLLILDELNVAISIGLVSLEKVFDLIKHKPENMELVITGRNAPEELIEAADLVTEMRLIKHPFQAGISAREGIEF